MIMTFAFQYCLLQPRYLYHSKRETNAKQMAARIGLIVL